MFTRRLMKVLFAFSSFALVAAACGDDDDGTEMLGDSTETDEATPDDESLDDDSSDGDSSDGDSSDGDSSDGEDRSGEAVSDEVIEEQRAALAAASDGAGPQAPRDIDSSKGSNPVEFAIAPPNTEMTLCNTHFHEAAEHKGGEFTTYAGNGDGEGYGTGYLYDGELSQEESAAHDGEVGGSEHGDLEPGDTVEIHYVFTTDDVDPGPGLESCLASEDSSPELRVVGQVYVLVNDDGAADLTEITEIADVDGLSQVPNIPDDLGTPVEYRGSTTGPNYNEEPSPFQVTWSVNPDVLKVDIASVDEWLGDNVFDEDHAHGVRNLVIDPELLSPIE